MGTLDLSELRRLSEAANLSPVRCREIDDCSVVTDTHPPVWVADFSNDTERDLFVFLRNRINSLLDMCDKNQGRLCMLEAVYAGTKRMFRWDEEPSERSKRVADDVMSLLTDWSRVQDLARNGCVGPLAVSWPTDRAPIAHKIEAALIAAELGQADEIERLRESNLRLTADLASVRERAEGAERAYRELSAAVWTEPVDESSDPMEDHEASIMEAKRSNDARVGLEKELEDLKAKGTT